MRIREAAEADVPGILAIFNEVISNTTAVYFDTPVTLDNRLAWFQGRKAKGFPVIVAIDDFGVIGFASFGEFRTSPCYRFTVEHTVHVRADQRRRGVGRTLITEIIPLAAAMGKHVLIAGIDADNAGVNETAREPRVRAHRSLPPSRPQIRSLARPRVHAKVSFVNMTDGWIHRRSVTGPAAFSSARAMTRRQSAAAMDFRDNHVNGLSMLQRLLEAASLLS